MARYKICLPEHDADNWESVDAATDEEAVLMHAERLCQRDPDWYRAFADGPTVLARADGDREIQRFEVELEQVPIFRSRRTGTRV